MMCIREISCLLILAVFGGPLCSCAADEGEPWARVRGVETSLIWESSPERIHPDGGWRTSTSYRVSDVSFRLEYAQIDLLTSGGDGASTSAQPIDTIDPSDPPPGCNLCHGGHCHCGGELIDYEDLLNRAQSGGGGGPSALFTLVDAWESELSPTTQDASVEVSELNSCEGERCDLAPSSIVGLELRLRRLRLTFTVIDLSRESARRIEGSRRVELDLPLNLSTTLKLEEPLEIGQGSQPEGRSRILSFTVTQRLTPELFDREWSDDAWYLENPENKPELETEFLPPEAQLELVSALLDQLSINLSE